MTKEISWDGKFNVVIDFADYLDMVEEVSKLEAIRNVVQNGGTVSDGILSGYLLEAIRSINVSLEQCNEFLLEAEFIEEMQ